MSQPLQILIVLLIFHTVSFTSSSFIEEEHQTWYYIGYTFFIIFCKKDLSAAELAQNGSTQGYVQKKCFKWFLFLLMHLILRKLNQTGDKWINEPDIGDHLNEEKNKFLLFFVFILGTFIIFKLIVSTNRIF